MSKHHELVEECLHELEKSNTGIELKKELETRFVRIKRLLLKNETRLYAVNSPCTIGDLAWLRTMLREWNKPKPYVTEMDIEAHAVGLIRMLEKE